MLRRSSAETMKYAKLRRVESVDVYCSGRKVFAQRSQYLICRSFRKDGSSKASSMIYLWSKAEAYIALCVQKIRPTPTTAGTNVYERGFKSEYYWAKPLEEIGGGHSPVGTVAVMSRSEADEYFSVDEIVLCKFTLWEDWRELVEGKCIWMAFFHLAKDGSGEGLSFGKSPLPSG
jgi:hypothetical protein